MRRLLLVAAILSPLGCADRSAAPKEGDVEVKDSKVKINVGLPNLLDEKEKKDDADAGLPSLAVLPFKSPSDLTGVSRACAGLAETLNASITRTLSGNPKLDVRAQAVVREWRDDPTRAGKALKARYVLTGEVKPQGDEIIVNLELMEVANGRQHWGNVYREPYKEKESMAKFEEKIAKEIAEAVAAKLGAKPAKGEKAPE